jgi:hypothetical protein
VIDRIDGDALPDRAKIRLTLHELGLQASAVQGGEQDGDEDGDDADHNQQFDEREGTGSAGWLLNRRAGK